jgi:hypothetical protein
MHRQGRNRRPVTGSIEGIPHPLTTFRPARPGTLAGSHRCGRTAGSHHHASHMLPRRRSGDATLMQHAIWIAIISMAYGMTSG